MTKSTHRKGLLPPKQKREATDVRYGVHALDSTKAEIMPRNRVIRRPEGDEKLWPATHRDAGADDPYLSPSRAEPLRAALLWIQAALGHSTEIGEGLPETLEADDLRWYCEVAKLTDAQTDAVLLVAEGWDKRQTAILLQVTEVAVRDRLRSARQKLAGWFPKSSMGLCIQT